MSKVSNFKTDLKDSSEVMNQLKPVICRLLKCKDLKTVEGDEDEICKILDLTCGIDYLKVEDDTGRVMGIGNRVQWVWPNCRPFNTFTIRKSRESGADTEFKKRKAAIENGGMYPYLTVHSYVESGTNKLLSVAIAKTTDVIDYIIKYDPPVKPAEDEHGKAWFYACSWDDMLDKGYYVLKCENCQGTDHDILLAIRPRKGA